MKAIFDSEAGDHGVVTGENREGVELIYTLTKQAAPDVGPANEPIWIAPAVSETGEQVLIQWDAKTDFDVSQEEVSDESCDWDSPNII